MGLFQLLAQHWSKYSGTKDNKFFVDNVDLGKVLTHTPTWELYSFDEVNDKLLTVQNGLKNHSKLTPHEKKQLSIEAEQLGQTELGRFLIMNNGALSGWWTYYCILGHKQCKLSNPVEKFLLEEAPVVLATQERFGHFQSVMIEVIEKNCHQTQPIKMASIPGGVAADLLSLNPNVDLQRCQLQFVNIDLDEAVLLLSKELAKELNCPIPLDCRQEDAWKLNAKEEFDLVASNGLNIYVPEREKVIALYVSLLKTLKPGGTLVTSALTPPPSHPNCEWKMNNIDQGALSRQAGIFAQILQARWSNFCTTDEMIARLTEAGLIDIEVIADSRNMFPTFVGHKPSL